MALRNIGQVVAREWDRVMTLSRYKTKPLAIGWWEGEAYVSIWDYRTGHESWKRLPSRDSSQPPKPPLSGLMDRAWSDWLP